MTPLLELRPYQDDVLERITKAEARGCRKQLVVMATGTGKTIVFAQDIERRGGRSVVLAHRDELIAQSVAKLMDVDPDLMPTVAAEKSLRSIDRPDLANRIFTSRRTTRSPVIGIVKAAANDTMADVVVASVQSLRGPRLAELARGRFTVVVCDEAHHSSAVTYRAVFDALEAGRPDGPLLVGYTATPDRGDGKGLDNIFDEVVASYDILWGIKSGYLCDLRGIEVALADFDERAMKVSRGDYTAGSAGAALEAANAPHLIAEAWQRETPDRKTLVFTPTVATAEATAEEFCAAGVVARSVSGETPAEERKQLWRDFRTGAVQVVSNCMVATEGFDEPSVDCIVLARPTKSRALYAQMVGRGTRRFPGKTDCVVLDVVGNSARHNLVTLPSLFGVEHDQKAREGKTTMLQAVEEAEAAGTLGASQKAALFKALPAPQITWAVTVDSRGTQQYVKPMGRTVVDGKPKTLPTVLLHPTPEAPGQWTVALLFPDEGRRRTLMAGTTLEIAQGIGEDYVRKNVVRAFVDPEAPWRKRPPSDRQVAAAYKWKLPNVEGYATAGELSSALDAHIAAKQLRREARR